MALPHLVRSAPGFLVRVCEAILPYLSQVLLGVVAFFALLKDWNEYGRLSRKWGRGVPLVIAMVTAIITLLGVYETYSARVEQASSGATITQMSNQIGQLRTDNQKSTDGFRDSFSKLYDRFSELQSKVQNADLLKEIKATKQELVETQNKLTPPIVTPIASFPARPATDIPITETTATRSDGFVEVHVTVYNPSDYNAKTGAVMVRVCEACKYADEPSGFVKVVGGLDSDREHDFQHIWAKTAMEDMMVHISVPPEVHSFFVGVFVSCENCSAAKLQNLKVTLQ